MFNETYHDVHKKTQYCFVAVPLLLNRVSKNLYEIESIRNEEKNETIRNQGCIFFSEGINSSPTLLKLFPAHSVNSSLKFDKKAKTLPHPRILQRNRLTTSFQDKEITSLKKKL